MFSIWIGASLGWPWRSGHWKGHLESAKVFGKPVFRTNLSSPLGGYWQPAHIWKAICRFSRRLCRVICTLRSPAGPSGRVGRSPFGRQQCQTRPIATRYLSTTSTESGLVRLVLSQSTVPLCSAAMKDTTVYMIYRHNEGDWRNPYPTAGDSWISLGFTFASVIFLFTFHFYHIHHSDPPRETTSKSVCWKSVKPCSINVLICCHTFEMI